MVKRFVLALIGAAVLVAGGALPAAAKGQMAFVVSGGDLTRPVTIDGSFFDAIASNGTEPYWHVESVVPTVLSGVRYRVRIYETDTQPRRLIDEWTYVPAASGAIDLMPNGRGPGSKARTTQWLSFSTGYNHEFLNAIKNGSSFPYGAVAFGIGLLLVVAATGRFLGEGRGRRALRMTKVSRLAEAVGARRRVAANS